MLQREEANPFDFPKAWTTACSGTSPASTWAALTHEEPAQPKE